MYIYTILTSIESYHYLSDAKHWGLSHEGALPYITLAKRIVKIK